MTEMALPLGTWLAERTDEQLVRLLELRPDLAQPTPGSMAALAARANARQSVKVASDDLDFLRLALLDVLVGLGADGAPVPVSSVLEALADRVRGDDVTAALDQLREKALVWGDDDVRIPVEAGAALPWFPGQALDTSGLSTDQVVAAIDALDEPAHDLLERLTTSSPMGRTREAEPGTPADRPVQRLLAAGLLRYVGDETVILPRDIGQVLRGEEPGPFELTPPDPVIGTAKVKDVDASAAGAAMELLRQIEVVLDNLSAAPVPELRNGGLGVRELKRLGKATGIDEPRLGLILELAAASGLIASGIPDPEPPGDADSHWAPTVTTDRFLETPPAQRWVQLASTWLDLPSRPGLVGGRGPDGKPYAALSESLFSNAAPLDRRLLLELLAELPPGSGVNPVSAANALVWRRPRWSARLQPGPVGHLLDEAHALGFTGRDALSSPARALLAGDQETAERAMTASMPAPVDHFLVQADLTVVVPGPLLREVADELAAVADLESAGAAMVYRVSEQSIRHALDTGRTAESLQAFFEKYSKTPVPQGLSYLINDVARRHGRLRVGVASSFVRCEDSALLAHAVAAPGVRMRLLAPTVAVSESPISEVLSALRSAGFAPAAEDSTGAIVDLRRRQARVPTVPTRRLLRPQPRPPRETLTAVVGMLRRIQDAPLGGGRLDPAVAMALLHQAAVHGKTVLMGYIDAAGVATQRVVTPISLHGGHLMAFDPAQGRLREFAVHRVTSVMSADTG